MPIPLTAAPVMPNRILAIPHFARAMIAMEQRWRHATIARPAPSTPRLGETAGGTQQICVSRESTPATARRFRCCRRCILRAPGGLIHRAEARPAAKDCPPYLTAVDEIPLISD